MPKHPLSPPIFPYPWAAEWGEDRYGLWQTLLITHYSRGDEARVGDPINLTASYVFRWIPPGAFWMGSPAIERSQYEDKNYRQVTLTKGFWIGEAPVTQAFYYAVSDSNPSHFKGNNLPVEQVSWHDVQGFINKLSRLHSLLKVRLPWEAEWEYACRAGSETAFHFGNELSLDLVNYRGTWSDENHWDEKAKQRTTSVKSYPCNDWGLYDTHGNVWEWCEDIWQDQLGNENVINPFHGFKVHQSADNDRVLRGGSWSNSQNFVDSSVRSRGKQDYRHINRGFRLALAD